MPGASSLHLRTLHHRHLLVMEPKATVLSLSYSISISYYAVPELALIFQKNVAPFLLVYQDYFAHIEIVIPHAAQGELAGTEPQLLYSPLVELAST